MKRKEAIVSLSWAAPTRSSFLANWGLQVGCTATCQPCLSAFPYKPVNWIGLDLRKSSFLILMSSSGFYGGCCAWAQGLSVPCHHVSH